MSLISEVRQYLIDESIIDESAIFAPYSPDVDGVMIAVRDTGGTAPDTYIPIENPTFQIYIRQTTYALGEAKLNTIRDLLHRQSNVQLVVDGIYFYFIAAQSNGGWIGKNENGMHEFTINFYCKIR